GIGLTGVGSSTINAIDAAQSLVGAPLTSEAIERAADLAAQAAQPRSDHRGSAAYKKQVVRTFVARILTEINSTKTKAA
ncbi:MAG: xanthine dehydrogenase family protein subunit M, partial [Actinobacteria bacterium]|nr:xanthine dehydrogenase family protein subunit M [Actinomycetota bacterium]